MKKLKDILKECFDDSFQIGSTNKQGAILTSKSNEENSISINWTNLGISRTFDSVIGLKYYTEVESIMNSVGNESEIQINYFGNKQNTINIFRKVDKSEINNDDIFGIQKQIDNIKKIVREDIEPLWDRLNTIQHLAEYVNKLDDEEISEFLANPTLIRKIAINKLADTSLNISDEIERVKKEYFDAENQYPKIFKNYSNAIKVFEKLIKSS